METGRGDNRDARWRRSAPSTLTDHNKLSSSRGFRLGPSLRFFRLTFPSLIAPSHTPPPLSGRESSPSIFQCWSVKKWKRRRGMDCGGTNDCLQVKNGSGNHSSTLSPLGPKEDQSLITSDPGQKLNWKSKHEYKREGGVTTRYSCWWWMECMRQVHWGWQTCFAGAARGWTLAILVFSAQSISQRVSCPLERPPDLSASHFLRSTQRPR